MKSCPLLLLLVFSLLCSLSTARAQDRLDTIRQRGELIIATDATYPPFEFREKEQILGFDVEIGNEIGRELGVKVRWLNLEWSGVLGSLESGKCDLVMAGVTITEERKKKGYLFSRPYFLSGQTIARRKGDTRIQKGSDLKGYRVSVQMQTTGQFAAERMGVPKDRLSKFDVLQDGLMDVRNGKSDALVADLPALKEILRKNFSELELIGGLITEENVGIVAWRSSITLMSGVNHALEKIIVDGRYAAIYNKWIGERLTTRVIGGLDKARKAGSDVPEWLNSAGKTTPESGTKMAPPSASALSIRWDVIREALPAMGHGAKVTLKITFLTLLFGIPGGLLVALGRISRFPFLRWIMVAYIEVVRGTPLLMQIYVIYFVLPALKIDFQPEAAGVLALSLNAAAYIAEIFRAGIESIDTGQMEAARSLGMDYLGGMRWVVLPQTFRRVLPPLTNEAIALLKDSSLVSVVAVAELMREGKEIATNSGSATTVYLAIAAIYLMLTLPLTYLARQLEIRWQPISQPRRRSLWSRKGA
ncbi:MAG: ABC transporter substrate-binding protein/permease [Armatimonadetes bacterium]|nr:ABC transporter substrate-binding protein/permease [Armatimonadota bacterium]